ncbi:inositol monophosphatase family protein [Streptomyces sp. NBC_01483]|uniref:inositol monophosphatase family protein n=1 Tax=Streptomyces sp. NBC_01483 TaxID=2903883 RepID=UPI002E351513|nr:inositol monophosphatase family protein [Streptomyces sp. NBC_01483]
MIDDTETWGSPLDEVFGGEFLARHSGDVEEAVRKAAATEILPRFRRLAEHEVDQKSGPHDLVTDADRLAERQLTETLGALLPGSVVVGEEAVHANPATYEAIQGDAPVWIIDPVDGTRQWIDRLPPSLTDSDSGIAFGQAGEVEIGEGFREIETAWTTGIAAMARAGARVIIDDVFLGGAASQDRLRALLEGLEVLWVGVRCDPETAAAREIARGDRATGMAASQAETVHKGVVYDVEVDTTRTESLDCARVIAAHVG